MQSLAQLHFVHAVGISQASIHPQKEEMQMNEVAPALSVSCNQATSAALCKFNQQQQQQHRNV